MLQEVVSWLEEVSWMRLAIILKKENTNLLMEIMTKG